MEKKNSKLQCCTCNKEFKKLSQLKRHRLIHTGDKPFECLNCCKRFSQKSSLETHKLIHSMEKPHICSKCNQRFSQKGNLNLHLKRIHLKNENEHFRCQHCNCCFKMQASLSTHLTKMHSSVTMEPNVNDILFQIDSLRQDSNCVDASAPDKRKSKPADYKQNQDMDLVMSLPKNFREITDITGKTMHVEYIVNEKKYLCSFCNKQFKHPSDLFRHNIVHSGERKFPCTKCSKSFGVRWNLKQHLRIHNRDEELKQECLKEKNRRYLTEIKNELRAERAIETSKNVQLANCKLFCIVPVELELSTIDNSPFEHRDHTIVGFSSNCPQDLAICHINDAHSVENARYCEYCNKCFKKETDLIRHRRKHTKEKMYICEHCGKKFSLKGTLKTHILLHLKNRQWYSCAVCGRNFSHQSSLSVHMRVHTGVRPYKCMYCERKFRTSGNRDKHHNAHRNIANKSGIKPEATEVRVSKMSKLFSTLNDSLQPHMPKQLRAMVHLKIKHKRKEFYCKWCKAKFFKKSQVDRHERIHTGIKPFKCDICDKSFNQKSTLKTHKVSHTKDRNFKCMYCSVSYKFKASLRDHHCISKHPK